MNPTVKIIVISAAVAVAVYYTIQAIEASMA